MRHKINIYGFHSTHHDAYITDEMMLNVEEQLNLYGKVPGPDLLECSWL
jgi:hypothetical protein